MAGNPFRKKPDGGQLPQLRAEEATKAFDDALQSVGAPDARRPSAVKKQVRIKTPPPLSPDSPVNTLIRRVSNEGHTGSPPPLEPVEGVGNPDDPFSKQFAAEIISSQSKEAIDNTRRNSETATTPAPPTAVMVLNPFQNTLATIEPGKAKDEVQLKKESQATDTQQQKKPGPAFDVDSFTKMLMTGAAPPGVLDRGQEATTSNQPQQSSDGSPKGGKESAASSITQPSMSEPSSASYADLSSASSDEEASYGEARKTAPAKASSKAPPPPVPRHKHGKSVQESGPQVVSFDDFNMMSRGPQPATRLDDPDLTSERKGSGSSDIVTRQNSNSNKSSEGSRRMRPPPPIPTARRTSSIKSQKVRDPKSSSITSNQPRSPGPPSPGLAKSSRAPPPPPSRRAGNRSSLPPDQLSASEITSLNSDNASLAGESMLSTDSSSLKQPSTGATLGSRNSSSSIPTTSQNPPPPPPRRQRGSSKSSLEAPMSENRRASHDNQLHAPGLGQVSEGGEERPQKDILGDLDAFQAEVEKLRQESLRRSS